MSEFTTEELTALIDSIAPQDIHANHPGVKALVKCYGQEATARAIYFAKDRLDIWELIRPHRNSTAAIGWARQHLEYALVHCPKLMGHWATFSGAEGMYLIDEVGRTIDGVGLDQKDRLAILQGQPSNHFPALGQGFKHAMAHYAKSYELLSPAWLGLDDSPLRAQAISSGWRGDMLPRMCRRHIDTAAASTWIAQWAFAYSLMLLDCHVCDPATWEFNAQKEPAQWMVAMDKQASPQDAVVAQTLLAHLKSAKSAYKLETPDCVADACKLLPAEEVTQLTSLVDVHMGLGLCQTLTAHFVQQSLMAHPDGKMANLDGFQTVVLPELSH